MVLAQRIRKVKVSYEIEFDNEEEPRFSREGGHEISFNDGMKPSKKVVLNSIKLLNEGFEDFFNENVEDNN